MIQIKKLYRCQKAVQVRKERPKQDEYDVNFSANKRDVFDAMRVLSPTAFSLYLYCISNQEGYTFGLSKQDVMAATDMKERSYITAVHTLIDLGYLVYSGEQATDGQDIAPLYIFYARPHPDAKNA